MVRKVWTAAAAVAAFLTVNAASAGTLHVPAGGDLQAAINTAQPGDTITLAAGATYVGNFELTVKENNPKGLYITIRSNADARKLPAAGQRILPTHSNYLPKIKSPTVEPAMRTAFGATYWRLQYLELLATVGGYGDIITLGSGDSAVQKTLAQVPSKLIIDQCYIHGDPFRGQKRGIALNSGETAILNSYVSDIKAVGFETQAIAGWNGPGPYTIHNNYLEGAGINFLLGGADPGIPDLVPTGVKFTGNHLAKQVSWRQPVLSTPTNLRATVSRGGSLNNENYYAVVAVSAVAMDIDVFSAATPEILVNVNRPSTATLRWNAVPGALKYRVYRSSQPNTQTSYFETAGPPFVDSGTAPPFSGPPPGPSTWSVKNLFELKNAKNVVVDSNLMEYNWTHSQAGHSILFTVRNQDGTAPWSTVDTVQFTNNVVRHVPGGINILGTDDGHDSQLTRNLVIRNNLFYEMSPAWGNALPWLLIGDGGDNITVDHNTVVHTGTLALLYGIPTTNFVYKNNMGRHNEYGFIGDVLGIGNNAINYYLPGAVFTKNVIVAGIAWMYPATNQQCGNAGETCFPTEAFWQAQFVDFGGQDYRLKSGGAYSGAGTDAKDLGANIDALAAAFAAAK